MGYEDNINFTRIRCRTLLLFVEYLIAPFVLHTKTKTLL